MHTDPAHGAAGPFGSVIASGWQVAILSMRVFIDAGGYSGEGIKTGLYRIRSHEGATGTISFDKDGAVTLPVTFKMVKDGKLVPYRD